MANLEGDKNKTRLPDGKIKFKTILELVKKAILEVPGSEEDEYAFDGVTEIEGLLYALDDLGFAKHRGEGAEFIFQCIIKK